MQNRKFIVLKDSAYELLEIINTSFSSIEEIITSSLIKDGLPSKPFCNSQILIQFNENKLIGPLEFIIDEHKIRLRMIIDDLLFMTIPIYSILTDIKIKPATLNERIFVDQKTNFGKIINYYNWLVELEKLVISENIKNHQIPKKVNDDQDNISKIIEEIYSKVHEQIEIKINQLSQEKSELEHQITQIRQDAIEIRYKAQQQIEKELAKVQDDIDEIRRKSQEQIEKEIAPMRQKKAELEHQIKNVGQILIENEAEIESKKIEKINLENEIIAIKNESIKLEKNIEVQRACMSQILNGFERSLTERFDQLAVEPTSILAEALANDAFLQFVLGKGKRRLELGSSTPPLSSNTPIFEIKRGPFFENTETLLTKYCRRLEQVDLDETLAAWTTAIVLSGQIPIFKGHALRRALNVFENHLTHGRCFKLPLSPEIISIERLFTIGQSFDTASFGILDTAILCATTHRDLLFILVLEGLDRAPSQYFLDTLLDWYERGLLDIPGDNLLSQHLERLWKKYNVQTQCGLAKEMIGWPSNLLLTATINGLADGFPMSSTALSQIVEINVESQGNHLDSHPALLEKIACKRAGEIAVDQWNNWREAAKNQDIRLMTQFITSRPQNEQLNVAKQEIALRVFAALCALEQSQDNALKIVQQYLLEFA